jgi:signal transduction histidine kinase
MSATAASVAQASPSSRSAPTRDPPSALALSGILTLLLGALLARGGDTLAITIQAEWKELLFWALLVVVLSFLPIAVDDVRLTLDDPILLALALLYPPEVAALVALLASFDLRELKGEVAFSRALFNRVQIGLSVYLAGAAFRLVSDGSLDPWPIAILGTVAAVAAEYVANCFLVSLHARNRLRLDFRASIRRLTVGNTGQFLATHLGYGSLALVLARLFGSVGAWSVAMFLVPILVARQMLVRGQAIHALVEKLKNRDRLLEKLSDRILDERRDERMRVAGDLHDEVLQDVIRIWLWARLLEKQGTASTSSDDVRELARASQSSIESIRNVIRGLKECSMSWGGLRPTLQGLVRDLRLEWKAKIQLHLPDVLDVDEATQLGAYQVVREALINSLKHAQASAIIITMQVAKGELSVQVEDDGIGYLVETVDTSTHFGLGLIEDRVSKLGGRTIIRSVPNIGTTVQANFPIEPA